MGQKITLVDGENILSDEKAIAEHFQNFFDNAVKALDLNNNSDILNNVVNDQNDSPIDIIIDRFKYHPSVLKIKEFANNDNGFSFEEVTLDEVKCEISKLKAKKATTFGSIPVKNLKETIDVVSPIIHDFFNQSIKESEFPHVLKLPDVSAVFKKDDATNSKNYRPVSVLPAVSKVFERFLHLQLSSYFEKCLSPKMYGYRKGFDAQYALVSLIEN